MTDIVISEFMDPAAVDRLAQEFDVYYSPQLVDQHSELVQQLTNARALIVRNRTQVTVDLLNSAPNLTAVGRLGVGLDNIDTDACASKNITVLPAYGANDDSVAEYVITTAMMLLRNAYQAGAQVINGDWPRQHCMGREIGGKTMGLIGCGAIARQTAKRAQALGMNVIAFDPHIAADEAVWQTIGRQSHLTELLKHADVISLHVPLTEQTQHLIDASAITQMKPSAVLINTARGGIVDEIALTNALKTGKLAGAALDVFEKEPLSSNDAALFANLDNVILTPHIAGVTEESNTRVSALIAEKITACLHRSS